MWQQQEIKRKFKENSDAFGWRMSSQILTLSSRNRRNNVEWKLTEFVSTVLRFYEGLKFSNRKLIKHWWNDRTESHFKKCMFIYRITTGELEKLLSSITLLCSTWIFCLLKL